VFDQNGLSLDQAPPITVVLRFFFIGALFGISGGLLMMWAGAETLDPASHYGRMMTHIMTLGVMLSFMLGALFQMLPVIAGVVLHSPLRLAAAVQYPFVLGTLSLLLGFWTNKPWLFIVAGLLLAISLLPLILLLLQRLFQLKNHSASSRGMLIALLSLSVVVGLGLYLTGTLGGILEGLHYSSVKTGHYSFGLFGWIALLIIAISFQSIEMFYVTPPHPPWMRTGLGWGLVLLLTVAAAFTPIYPDAWLWGNRLIALLLITYGGVTFHRLTQRKRPLTDATVWFWRIGLISLIAAMVVVVIDAFIQLPPFGKFHYLFFAVFGVSVLFAMLYKIIPFLTWFHLNSQGYLSAPMMHEVIHPKTAKMHLYIHLATLLVLLLAPVIPTATQFAGVGVAISFGWLLYQIVHAHRLYHYTQEHSEKFDFNFSTS
jgi:hypothetical protein